VGATSHAVTASSTTIHISNLPPAAAYAIAVGVVVLAIVIAALLGRRAGRRALSQRLTALGSRLGLDAPEDDTNIETALSYLEQVTGAASQAVAESSADAIRLRRSLDTLPQGVVVCDESGAVVYRNDRAGALMVSRHGDALAAHAVTELLEHAWQEGSAERTIDLYGPPRRTLTVRARQIDDGRRPLGVIAMIEDVSERRRLEEVRRDFVANVSHELKTPMGALGLLAETLESEPDPEVARRLAGRIHTEAFRVSRIIDDLLDLSRIESEEAPPREPILVNLVMAEAVERVRASADQRGIRIDLVEPSPPVAVQGDRRQLVSAMHALIENAVTYSYDDSVVTVTGSVQRESLDGDEDGDGTNGCGATIAQTTSPPASLGEPAATSSGTVAAPSAVATVSTTVATDTTGGHRFEPLVREQGELIRLAVADHGIGIPARDLDRIFERFYRVDHGRSRDTGGTGLGLSIVRHVANNHQGWVDVESREGEGSTFTLVLPLKADRAL
jgi:two-component system sensor histidine kinase SenX3